MTDKIDFEKMRSLFFFAITFVLFALVVYLLFPFFYPIFWATIIAVLLYPLYDRINRSINLPGVSAFTVVILTVVLLVLPVMLLGFLIINQSVSLYSAISHGDLSIDFSGLEALTANTPLAKYVATLPHDWSTWIGTVGKTISVFVVDNLQVITENSIRLALLLFVSLYTLFYLLKDGEKILLRLMHFSPLGDRYDHMLFQRFASTTRATIKGSFIIAFIQGLIGGITFWATGIQGAFILGVIMMFTALIPGVGTGLVWLPIGLVSLALGHVWQGIAILIMGTFVVGTIDNFLRPPLVGKDIQMHPLLVLFSTLGGVLVFGISGIMIGPIITALFLSVLSIYNERYREELAENNQR